jgi:hypothetical protein
VCIDKHRQSTFKADTCVRGDDFRLTLHALLFPSSVNILSTQVQPPPGSPLQTKQLHGLNSDAKDPTITFSHKPIAFSRAQSVLPDNNHYNYNGTPTAISEAETEFSEAETVFSETASAFEILRARTLEFANTLSSAPSPFCPEYSDDAKLLAPSVTADSFLAAAASILAAAAGVATAVVAYEKKTAAAAAFGGGNDVDDPSCDGPESSI